MALAVTLALHVGISAFAPEGAGSAEEVPLEWTAADGCPDRARGVEHLRRFLGDRRATGPVRVQLMAEGAGYAGAVAVDGASRTLHAADCETLARAVALVVAVSMDPVAAAAVIGGESQGSGEPELDVGVPEPAFVVPEPGLAASGPGSARELRAERGRMPRSDRSALAHAAGRADAPRRSDARRADARPAAASRSHSLGLSGGLGWAVMPALTGVIRLGHAFDRGALRLQTELAYATPRAITYPAGPPVGGRFQSLALSLRACFAPGSVRVSVPLCAGVEGGPVLGRGLGVEPARSPVGLWLGGLGSATAVIRVHPRLACTAGADLVLGLRRPAFHVGARETLFRAPLVGLRALVGLELRLR